MDDGSSDGTAGAIAEGHPDVLVLRHEQARGFTAAANAGWARARAEVVLLLNSDTVVDAGALDALLDAFGSDPALGVAGASLRHPDGRPQWSAGPYPSPLWLFLVASGLGRAVGRLPGVRRARPEAQRFERACWVPATAMAVRRAVRERLGGFDERYRLYAQDLAYGLAARRAGFGVRQLSGVGVVHLGGATIGPTQPDARERQDPVALTEDLCRWLDADLAGWPRRRGRLALRFGWWVRLLGRRLMAPRAGTPERAAFDAMTQRYRRARRAAASA